LKAAKKKKAIQIINAIEEDWAFTDPEDAAACYLLVDADRNEHAQLQPEKEFVSQLEKDGFIKFCKKRGEPRGTKRKVMNVRGKEIVVPLVHFFTVCKKGLDLKNVKKPAKTTKNFSALDDDDAQWFICKNFIGHPTVRGLEMTVEIVLESLEEEGRVCISDAIDCLASCEILARLQGNWGAKTERSAEVDKWVESNDEKVPAALITSAVKAIDAILGPKSGLAKRWSKSEHNNEWRDAVMDISTRMRG
jgi:hypothetical protein